MPLPSFAERLIEQGRIKGEREAKRKGFIKGMQDILIILIRHKFGVSPQEEEMIRSVAGESKLDAAAEAVPRYLTKSRFALAVECPSKPFYTGKSEYANRKLEDPFLEAA